MSSVENFLEPTLMNFRYKPIRLHKNAFTADNELYEVEMYVFVGLDTPIHIQKILNGLYKKNYVLNAEEKKELKHAFGDDYEVELGLNAINKKRHGGTGINRRGSMRKSILSDEYDIKLENDNAESSKNYSDDDGIEIKKTSLKRMNETEIFEEAIDSSINDYNVLFNEKVPELSISKNASSDKSKGSIIYIYDSIVKFHTVSDLMYKVLSHLHIPIEFQNLSYIAPDSTVKNLLYKINYLVNNAEYYVNLLNVMNSIEFVKKIPVDTYFQKKFLMSHIMIHDLRKMLLIDYGDLGRDIHIINAYDILKPRLINGIRDLTDIAQKNIYEGFIVKYFPQMSFFAFKDFVRIGNPVEIKKMIELPKQVRHISNVDEISNVVSKTLSYNIEEFADLKPSKIRMASCIVKSNLITKNLGERVPVFNLKLIFKLFITNQEIPFIIYSDVEEKIKTMKYSSEIEMSNPTIINQWKKIEKKKTKIKNYIILKVLKYKKGHKRYTSTDTNISDFVTIHLYSHGTTDTRCSWVYTDNVDFITARDEVLVAYENLTEAINRTDNIAFNGFKTIPFPEEIEYSHIKFLFDIDYGKIENFMDLENYIFSEYPGFFKKNNDYTTTPDKLVLGYIKNHPNNIFGTKDHPVNKFFTDQKFTNMDTATIAMEIDNNLNPRIVLNGNISNYKYFVIIYNFILRIITMYIKDVQGKVTIDKNEKQQIKKINMSKLRKLQQRDDALFNFRSSTGDNPYSRICQQHKQPDVFTLEEFRDRISEIKDAKIKAEMQKALDETESSENVLVYGNKTRPGTNLYYMCSDKIYKYPGFQIGSDKHPTHFCLPCCKKLPSVIPHSVRLNNNMKQYLTCIGKADLIHKVIEPTEHETEMIQLHTENYVKMYGKDIGFERVGHIPIILAKLFNIKQDFNYLNPKTDTLLLFGTVQGKWSLLTAVFMSLNVLAKNEGIDRLQMMFDDLIKNPDIYEKLSNGLVKQSFPLVTDYIKYFMESVVIDEYLTLDFIRIFAPRTIPDFASNKINVIIFADTDDDVILDYVDKDQSTVLYERFTIILLRQNNILYRPIIRYKNSELTSVFDTTAPEIQLINQFIKTTESISVNYSIGNTSKYADIDNSRFTVDIVLNNASFVDIVGQIINSKNLINFIVMKYKKQEPFIFPVQTQNIIKNIDVVSEKKYNFPSINTIKDFFDKSNFTYRMRRIVISNNSVIGLINDIGIFFPVIPISQKNYKKEVPQEYWKLQVLERSSDILDTKKINTTIFNHSSEKTFITPELQDYQYNKEIYELMKLEISNFIANEINEDLRNIINKLLESAGTTTKDIIGIHSTHPEVSLTDREIIRKIFERPISKRTLDDNQRYDFDTIIKNKLIKLSNNITEPGSKKEIEKILLSIIKQVIFLSEPTRKNKEFVNNEIRSVCGNYDKIKWKCEGSMQCMWNTSGKCKLIMSPKDNVYYVNLMLKDFMNNAYVRESIIYNTISPIKINTYKNDMNTKQMVETVKAITGGSP
jgi:hypothetical protein